MAVTPAGQTAAGARATPATTARVRDSIVPAHRGKTTHQTDHGGLARMCVFN